MKPFTPVIIVLFSLGINLQTVAQHPNRLSRVKISVPVSPVERVELITLLQLDHFQEHDGFIETEIGQREIGLLTRQSRFSYQVLVNDVGARLEEINRPYFEGRKNGTMTIEGTPVNITNRVAFEQPDGLLSNIIVTPSAFVVQTGSPNLGGYYRYDQMVTAIVNLFNTYSPGGLVDTFHIGTSIEGRIIYAVKISDNAATDEANEPEVFFQGIQHAREAIGGSSMIFLMQYLCEQYANPSDTRIKNLVDNREIYIIVCMNPDGWEYNRSIAPNGGGGWRKNRRNIAASSEFGVDLNRNWSQDWGNCVVIPSSCASDDPADDTYYGTGAFSEPETQAVRNFIKSKHIVVANDQHSVGPYFSLPFGRPILHPAPDSLSIMQQQWYTAIPALMGKYNGMRAGNSFQALGYEVAGGVKDWMLKGEVGSGIGSGVKNEILGMTGEGGYGTTGAATFWPPATSIITLCKGMTYQNLQMIYSAGSYVDIQDMTDIAIPNGATSGNFSFKIKRLGVDNQPVTASLVPVINVSSVGLPVVVNTLTNYYDTYTGNISYTLPGGITSGQRVRFAWKVETAGYSYSDTITKIYNPTTLFSDDMETGAVGSKWTVSSSWNYVIDSGHLASKALTESPGTTYPASTTRTAAITNPISLGSATASYISFLTKHKAENFHDKLQVQVALNSGGPWTAIAGKTTVREPGTNEGSTINGQPSLTGIQPDWVKEEFNLASYLGNATVYIRFAFTSDASSSFYAAQDGGFYIDNLKVISTNTVLQTLGANFLSFTGKLLPDNTIELKWDAAVDQKHRYFEVEKSSDRINFVSIGRIEGSMLYRLIDNNPFNGNNFYRIKEVDVDGKAGYSNIVNVVYNPAVHYLQLYPNPVKDYLNIRVKLNTADKINIQVSDLSGRIVNSIEVNAGNSIQDYQIGTKRLASDVYILKVLNSRNEVISVQKFIKQ